MKEQNRFLEVATEKRKRGRPSIDIGATSFLGGTRRTKVNAKYMFEAVSLISEAASEIPDNHLLWYSDDKTQRAAGKHGILEQIGRMWLQDHMTYASCVLVANYAIIINQTPWKTCKSQKPAIRRRWKEPKSTI